MCGSLRLEGLIPVHLNDSVEFFNARGELEGSYRWEGWARTESIQEGTWSRHSVQEGYINYPEYTEKGAIFKVPPGKKIRAIVTNNPRDPKDPYKRQLRIVTRSCTREETKESLRQGKRPHPRHPDFV